MGLTLMEQMKVVGARFGDEESNLLDRFERLSFEIQLNQAILGRSLSQPATFTSHTLPPPSSPSSSHVDDDDNKKVAKSSISSRFLRAFNRIFHPKAAKERLRKQKQASRLCKLKEFSRSLRDT